LERPWFTPIWTKHQPRAGKMGAKAEKNSKNPVFFFEKS
jgi:hypothetical protein